MIETLHKLRWVGMLEGVSFLLLLGLAMPMKYALQMPIGVQVMGPIHGALFMLYVLMAWYAARNDWLSSKHAAGLVAAAFLPFGPFVVDRQLKKLASDGA